MKTVYSLKEFKTAIKAGEKDILIKDVVKNFFVYLLLPQYALVWV